MNGKQDKPGVCVDHCTQIVLFLYTIYGKWRQKKYDERLDAFWSFGLKLLGLHEGWSEVKKGKKQVQEDEFRQTGQNESRRIVN